MAENNTIPSTGDIGMIRSILMGQQMDDYEKRFTELQQELSAAQAKLKTALETSNGETQNHLTNLESSMEARFAKLEKNLAQQIASINDKIEKVSKNDKAQIGKMLVSIGQKLMDSK